MSADGLRVTGGAGGTAAELADLESAAAVLGVTGADLAAVAQRLRVLSAGPWLMVGLLRSPVSATRLEAALQGAVLGPSGAAGVAGEASALGAALELAAATYRRVDAATAALLRRLEVTTGRSVGWLLLPLARSAVPALGAATAVVVFADGDEISADVERSPVLRALSQAPARVGPVLLDLLGRLPGGGDHVVGTLPALVSVLGGVPALAGRRPPAVARAVTGFGGPWPSATDRVGVVMGPPRPARPPTGVGDLVARTSAVASGSGAPPGTVRVDRVSGADGNRSWVVYVPGVQEWSPRPGSNPMDLTGAVQGMGGRPTALGATVTRALAGAGARPGEPVLLAGHSLGGITAASLAADPVFRERFTVTHVVTAGSPVAASGVPDDVAVLALEHDEDPVPWLDGAANPDRPNWVTVHRDLGGAEQAATAHDLDAYGRTAELAAGSADPSLQRWQEGLTVFLDRPGAEVTSWEVTGRRVDPAAGPPAP